MDERVDRGVTSGAQEAPEAKTIDDEETDVGD